MSRDVDGEPGAAGGHARRSGLLHRLGEVGRRSSDAAVMYHSVLAERLGIGPTDWKTLGLLDEHGPLTAGEIGARSGLAPASVTGVVTRLERRGYVRRRKDDTDGRRVVVELAAGLKQSAGELFEGYSRRLDQLMERYTEAEIEVISDFLEANARIQTEAAAELSESPR